MADSQTAHVQKKRYTSPTFYVTCSRQLWFLPFAIERTRAFFYFEIGMLPWAKRLVKWTGFARGLSCLNVTVIIVFTSFSAALKTHLMELCWLISCLNYILRNRSSLSILKNSLTLSHPQFGLRIFCIWRLSGFHEIDARKLSWCVASFRLFFLRPRLLQRLRVQWCLQLKNRTTLLRYGETVCLGF